jgi:hypothetical protein
MDKTQQNQTPSEPLSKPSTNSEPGTSMQETKLSARELALMDLTGESSIEEAEAHALNLG